MNANSQRIICSFLSVVGAAGLVAFSSPASASSIDVGGARQVAVKYHDLDLTRREGRETLDRRIDNAASQVCTTGQRITPPSEITCRRNAVQQAQRAIGIDAIDARG